MQTKIIIEGIVDGLNGKSGLIREHFHSAKKKRDKYRLLILSQTKNRHVGKVVIEYIGYKLRFMDWDNFSASFKHIGDALVKAQVIQDDNPKIIIDFLPKQIKVSKRKEQRVEIIINDV
mgnify:CR=1 FL=1